MIRLDGDFGMGSAEELKGLLMEGLASGKDLRLDLEEAGDLDITFLQLMWAAGREAVRTGTGFTARLSATAAGVIRDAGFASFPGQEMQDRGGAKEKE